MQEFITTKTISQLLGEEREITLPNPNNDNILIIINKIVNTDYSCPLVLGSVLFGVWSEDFSSPTEFEVVSGEDIIYAPHYLIKVFKQLDSIWEYELKDLKYFLKDFEEDLNLLEEIRNKIIENFEEDINSLIDYVLYSTEVLSIEALGLTRNKAIKHAEELYSILCNKEM